MRYEVTGRMFRVIDSALIIFQFVSLLYFRNRFFCELRSNALVILSDRVFDNDGRCSDTFAFNFARI